MSPKAVLTFSLSLKPCPEDFHLQLRRHNVHFTFLHKNCITNTIVCHACDAGFSGGPQQRFLNEKFLNRTWLYSEKEEVDTARGAEIPLISNMMRIACDAATRSKERELGREVDFSKFS